MTLGTHPTEAVVETLFPLYVAVTLSLPAEFAVTTFGLVPERETVAPPLSLQAVEEVTFPDPMEQSVAVFQQATRFLVDPVAIAKLDPLLWRPEEQEFSQILREGTEQKRVPGIEYVEQSPAVAVQVVVLQVLAAQDVSGVQVGPPPQNILPL